MKPLLFKIHRYCAMDPDASVAEMGIKCIGKIGKDHLLASNKSLELLIGLLESNLDHVTAYVFDAIKGEFSFSHSYIYTSNNTSDIH